jgi:hypothetical protein
MNIIEEIKQQYPMLQKWEDHAAYEIYKGIQSHQILQEFLSTVNSKTTTDQLIKQTGYGVRVLRIGKYIDLEFGKLSKDYLDKVNKFMDKFGWYPSYIGTYTKEAGKYSDKVNSFIEQNEVIVHYEAKYDEEIEVKGPYLYHLTPDIKWPKIKVFGLTPKTQGKLADHPGRIYLLTSLEGEWDIDELTFALLNSYTHKERVKEMYLLKIDISQIKDHKFFEDPNFYPDEAVWTYQNIPPSSITIIKKYNMVH